MEPLTLEQIAFARRQVGEWLRLRARDPLKPNQCEPLRRAIYSGEAFGEESGVRALFVQLGADADHSALLWRLLNGKEPLREPPPLKNSYPVYPD